MVPASPIVTIDRPPTRARWCLQAFAIGAFDIAQCIFPAVAQTAIMRGKSHGEPAGKPTDEFGRRLVLVIVAGGIVFLLWELGTLCVLLFGAILMSVGLRSAARFFARKAHVGETVGLTVTVILLVATFGLAGWFFGSVVQAQVDQLFHTVPEGLRLLLAKAQQHPYARFAMDHFRSAEISGMTGWAATNLASLISTVVGAIAVGIIMLFVAVFFAAEPGRYRQLAFRFFPGSRTALLAALFDRSGEILRRWLVGQLAVMLMIGVFTGIGLWLLGIESALALGLVGGLFCFVPYVGAILAAVPATLVALTQSPLDALAVIVMYAGVHFVEGNFLSPLIQERATELPPVLSLVSILAFNTLFGPAGVLVAVPMTLFILSALEVLYVERMDEVWNRAGGATPVKEPE